MSPLDRLAEQRIAEALARGDFVNLPGAGRPLALDDDRLVPEELRGAYRLLKNAGCVPPEVAAHGELKRIEQLLQAAQGGERTRLLVRLNFLLARAAAGRRRGSLRVEEDYYRRLAARITAREG